MTGATPSDLVALLRDVVGGEHVFEGEAAIEHAGDRTFLSGRPLAAVSPADTGEVVAVVRLCSKTATPIVCRGAGTGLAGGAVAVAGGVTLNLGRLQELEVDPANLSATAGAGVITGHLAAAAAKHGLFYPRTPRASRSRLSAATSPATRAGCSASSTA